MTQEVSSKVEKSDLLVLRQLVQPHLDALEDFLVKEIDSLEDEVSELAGYCMKHTGKQLRPMLLFFSGWQGMMQNQ